MISWVILQMSRDTIPPRIFRHITNVVLSLIRTKASSMTLCRRAFKTRWITLISRTQMWSSLSWEPYLCCSQILQVHFPTSLWHADEKNEMEEALGQGLKRATTLLQSSSDAKLVLFRRRDWCCWIRPLRLSSGISAATGRNGSCPGL